MTHSDPDKLLMRQSLEALQDLIFMLESPTIPFNPDAGGGMTAARAVVADLKSRMGSR